MRLESKKALFMSASSNIAVEAAKHFLKEGASLMLAARGKSLNKVRNVFGTGNPNIGYVAVDITDYDDVVKATKAANELLGRIDILVNYAGLAIQKPIDKLTIDDWKVSNDINLNSVFYACKAVVPYMREHNYGRIINLSSASGRTSRPNCGIGYAAAKAAVIGMSKRLAGELAPYSITVNCIAPGPLEKLGARVDDENNCKLLFTGIPLGRPGKFDEIASAVVYLASDESAWTTGAVLDINGGVF